MEIAIVVTVVVILCAFFIGWPALVRHRRSTDPNYSPPRVIGVLDELYQPSAHNAELEKDVRREMSAPAPNPDEPDLDRGHVTIDLDNPQNYP